MQLKYFRLALKHTAEGGSLPEEVISTIRSAQAFGKISSPSQGSGRRGAQSYFGVTTTFAQRFVPLCLNLYINFSFRCLDGVFDHKGYTEKSLTRMVKAKAKADRAAARLAAHQAHVAAREPSSTAMVPAVDREASPATGTDVPSHEVDEAGDHMAVEAVESEVVPDRTEMLRLKSAVVAEFMQLLVPILIDVYAANVITPVRIKTLTGLLKAVSFLDGDGLKRVLMVSLSSQSTSSAF